MANTYNENKFYNDEKNFLFVKKGKDGKLLDYIFIHIDDTENMSFIAHYVSYKSDTPLEVYKFEKVDCPDEIDNNTLSQVKDFTEEEAWKRVRVSGMLPSKWRMYFENLEEILKNKR